MANVIINPDKTISIDGKKTFPLIMYSLCNSDLNYTTDAQCNVNLQTPYDVDLTSIRVRDITKDQYAQYNKFFVTGTYDHTNKVFYGSPNRHSSHPNFFGYYMRDEPPPEDHANQLAQYKYIKSIDTDHIVIMGQWQYMGNWLDCCDMMLCGLYPYRQLFINEAGGRQYCLYVYEHLIRFSASIRNFDDLNKPIFPVIQAVGCTDDAGVLTLSKQELRALTYTAICMNVKGLSYYNYTWTPNNCGLVKDQSLVKMYSDSATELKTIENILLLPTKDYHWQYRPGTQVIFSSVLSETVFGRPYTNFNYLLKQDGNTWYLIVVNKDSRPISDVGITVTGLSGSMTVKTLGLETSGSGRTGRVITANNGQFTDSFDGLAVHIYQIGDDTSLPPPPPEPEPEPQPEPEPKPKPNTIWLWIGLGIAAMMLSKKK